LRVLLPLSLIRSKQVWTIGSKVGHELDVNQTIQHGYLHS
jgi:hypothetical protein